MRARPILPGARVKITRRCLEGRSFLATGRSPDEIKNFYGYTLGIGLMRYGLDFHGANQMSNHHHLDVNDVRGNLPAFKNSVHGNLARGLNAKRGRDDKFWTAGPSCDTNQPSDEESLEDLVYTEFNPVEAGLVNWAGQWPGFTSHGWRFGETRTFTRPDWYYDPENPDNPPEVRITRVRPNIFPELTDDELFERLMKRVRECELAKHEEMRRTGRRFMGIERVARQRWDRVPRSSLPRFSVIPKVASSSRWRRLAQIRRNRAWEREYAIAREKQRQGKRPIFPAGTYYLRLHAGVRVAQLPP